MIKRSSPHVHTQFCDGRNTAEEMALAAIDRGFVSLGFSSHARSRLETSSLSESGEAAYITEIDRLKDKYQGRLRIRLGIERDRFSHAERAPFEYVIGSAHFLPCPDGSMLGVDAAKDTVTEGIRLHFAGDGLRFARAYYALLGNYISVYRPDIIGHFDLISKNNRQGDLFDPDCSQYIKAATEAMDEAVTGCSLLEVNTGAMARHGTPFPYPSLPLLKYWRALGGEVILSSDCHSAEWIDFGYGRAEEHIRRAGYKKAAILGRQDALFEWFELR